MGYFFNVCHPEPAEGSPRLWGSVQGGGNVPLWMASFGSGRCFGFAQHDRRCFLGDITTLSDGYGIIP